MEAFLKGMRCFFSPTIKPKTTFGNAWERDKKSLADDWKVLGEDFRKVIKKYVRK